MISVIIPCHNCAGFINRSVDSVLRQTYQNTEVILVNNNSTDNTLSLLRDYGFAYPDKIQVYNEYRKGAPAARNYGLNKAKGDWIQFLDADDELLPNKLQIQYDLAISGNADVVAGNCLLKYNVNGKVTDIIRRVEKDVWKGLVTSNLGITSSNLWRKRTLLNVNGWNETLTSSQEYDLLFRLLKNNAQIIHDSSINTIVYFSGDSISKSENKEKMMQILNNRIILRLNIKKYLESSGLLTRKLTEVIDTYIYTEIMRYYPSIPIYAKELLKKHPLKVNIRRILKLRSKALFYRLRALKRTFL
jgi:glycosyltransferase involved in cell wall biosynthesis